MATFLIKIFLISLIGISPLLCDEIDPVLLKNEIIDNYNQIVTYKADFSQQNYWYDLDTGLASKGVIYFNTTNLKLEYSDPAGQFLVLDSLRVVLYDPASNQAMISAGNEIDIRPVSLISRYWLDSLLVSCREIDNKIEVIMRSEYNDEIKFLLQNELITELTYTDVDRNTVTYKFSNVEINLKLPEKVFEVNLPEDANLLDTRE